LIVLTISLIPPHLILPRRFRRIDGWAAQQVFIAGKICGVVKEHALDPVLFAPSVLGIESS
jgi:hypothetical protein